MSSENGTAYFLVHDPLLESCFEGKDPFYNWLRGEGFNIHKTYSGIWQHCKAMYININNKTIAFSMPGIKCFDPLGNHVITIEEFKTIYEIYKKYEGKPPLQF